MFPRISLNGIETGTLSWSKVAWICIALVSSWHMFAVRLNADHWKYVIASDGAGYYAYLPATFIYHDLNYGFAEKNAPTYQSYPGCDVTLFGNKNFDGKRINKYFIGTSILQAPFFFAAYFLSSLFDYPAGGYSFLFQAFICLAAIFYLLAGLYCIRKLLRKMEFSDNTVTLVMLLLFFGTNLYHYALEEPSMSHVYSFALISFFLLQLHKLHEAYSRKRIIFLALTFTLIILIRPTNGIVLLLVPFFLSANEFRLLSGKLFADKKAILFSICISSTLIFLQLLVWKISGGHWKEDSYLGEKLNLLHPQFSNTLFSWRKGFFIYTPLLLFSITGLVFVRPVSKAVVLLCFLAINCWIISSWHDWSYGGSFGMRPFVDTYAVFALLLAFLLRGVENIFAKSAFAVIAVLLVFLNLFQIYQYHNAILPYEYMTWEKYKRIFLKSEKVFAGIFAPGSDHVGELPKNSVLLKTFKRNFDNDTLYLNQSGVVRNEQYFSSPGSARLDDSTKFCADLFLPVAAGLPDSTSENVWIKAGAKIWLGEDATDAKLVISFKDENSSYEWNGFFIVHRISKTKSWQEYSIAVPLPQLHSTTELISVYVLKGDDKLLYVDDLEVSFWKAPPPAAK